MIDCSDRLILYGSDVALLKLGDLLFHCLILVFTDIDQLCTLNAL